MGNTQCPTQEQPLCKKALLKNVKPPTARYVISSTEGRMRPFAPAADISSCWTSTTFSNFKVTALFAVHSHIAWWPAHACGKYDVRGRRLLMPSKGPVEWPASPGSLPQRGLWPVLAAECSTPNSFCSLLYAETNLGGTLQLLVDLKFLAGAFSPLVKAPHEASIAACRQLITEQAVALAQGQSDEPDPLAERLDAWLDSCEVSCKLPLKT